MMSGDDETGLRSSSQSVLFCILLLIISGLPSYVGLTNTFYLPIALALSGWFVVMAMRFHRRTHDGKCARAFSLLDHLSAAAPRRAGSDETMRRKHDTACSDERADFPLARSPGKSHLFSFRSSRRPDCSFCATRRWRASRTTRCRSSDAFPPFVLTDQDGKPFGSEQLQGKIWIADFIYTTCPGPCPMISSRMSETQKPLEDTDVKLVSFSVDPAHDTPAVLRDYAKKLHAQPGRWEFLTGDKSTIYHLSRDGFKLATGSAARRTTGPQHSDDPGRSQRRNPRLLQRDRRGRRHPSLGGYDPPPSRRAEVEFRTQSRRAEAPAVLYFVANGGGAIVSTQLVSRDFASPLCRNLMMSRSTDCLAAVAKPSAGGLRRRWLPNTCTCDRFIRRSSGDAQLFRGNLIRQNPEI